MINTMSSQAPRSPANSPPQALNPAAAAQLAAQAHAQALAASREAGELAHASALSFQLLHEQLFEAVQSLNPTGAGQTSLGAGSPLAAQVRTWHRLWELGVGELQLPSYTVTRNIEAVPELAILSPDDDYRFAFVLPAHANTGGLHAGSPGPMRQPTRVGWNRHAGRAGGNTLLTGLLYHSSYAPCHPQVHAAPSASMESTGAGAAAPAAPSSGDGEADAAATPPRGAVSPGGGGGGGGSGGGQDQSNGDNRTPHASAQDDAAEETADSAGERSGWLSPLICCDRF